MVGDGVGLQEHRGGFAGFGFRDFPVNRLAHAGLDHQRGYAQLFVIARGAFKLHAAEEFRGILPDCRIGGDHRQVGVELGGFLVVVARAQLRDELQPIFAATRDGADFRVHLVVAEAVDDVASGLLEALRPFDVVAFVEAGAQLEERGDVFAVFCCGDERFGQTRLARQAIQRDFDRNHVGVNGGFLQELHERVHGLVRVRE